MNLDELQSVRDRERQSDSLQQLRDSFYADAGEMIQELREERDAAAERADDPFDDPEVNRITNDINTAEQTVEAIYERRVGKLVKMASFAAADMPTEDEGLTAEERELFEGMVASIENNRDRVFAILDGEDPEAVDTPDATANGTPEATPDDGGAPAPDPSPTGTADPADSSGETGQSMGVDAADLMGSGEDAPTAGAPEPDGSADSPDSDRPVPPQEPQAADDAGEPNRVEGEPAGTDTSVPSPGAGQPDADGAADPTRGEAAEPTPDPRSDGGATAASSVEDSSVDRRTVRITSDVGEILGVDERAYDLASEDVVTLPAANADPLVERDAAEPLDR
jgi:DNA replication factor GINS